MRSNAKGSCVTGQSEAAAGAHVCPLCSPWFGRTPGLLALAAVPAAMAIDPLFFGLAGGLLATLSLLVSPPGSRTLGMAGLVGALVAGSIAAG